VPSWTVGDNEFRAATRRNEARLRSASTKLYSNSLSLEQAAQQAGMTSQQIAILLRDGDLLAMDGPDGLRVPAWQFDSQARYGRLEGIASLASAFPGGVLSLSHWAQAHNAGLDGRTPRQALLDGDVELVVAVAAHHGA
jgi:hypothetical protein